MIALYSYLHDILVVLYEDIAASLRLLRMQSLRERTLTACLWYTRHAGAVFTAGQKTTCMTCCQGHQGAFADENAKKLPACKCLALFSQHVTGIPGREHHRCITYHMCRPVVCTHQAAASGLYGRSTLVLDVTPAGIKRCK
jgi:hypothetical protein